MNIDNTEKVRQEVREILFQTFAKELNSKEQAAEIMERFDTLTDVDAGGKMSAENGAKIIYSSYGSTNGRNILTQIGKFIFDNLETYNATSPGVDKNPNNRWKNMATRYNKMIDAISITYNNGLELDKEERERLKIVLPSFINPTTVYTATASKLGLEVK